MTPACESNQRGIERFESNLDSCSKGFELEYESEQSSEWVTGDPPEDSICIAALHYGIVYLSLALLCSVSLARL